MKHDTVIDTGALEELDHDECLKRVATMSVGRVAVAADDGRGPIVVPVNYVLDGEFIVFRSGAGTKLHALRDAPMSFQVDVVDPSHHTGWSVLIRGVAYEVTAQEVKHLAVEPWAPGGKHHWIRLVPTAITGRNIRLPDVPWDTRGYL
jgi:nitroimidazol reductase NimA-like FMN-containing flavoprotein (pyridoxamine 5'-phosphate oxidase superfamily)